MNDYEAGLPATNMDFSADHARLAAAVMLQRLVDMIPTPILVKNSEYRWVLVNAAMEMLHGRPRRELLGKTDFELMAHHQAERLWSIDKEVLSTGITNEQPIELNNSDGRRLYLVTRKARLVAGDDPDLMYIVAVISDVTKFRVAEEQARFLAQHDTLTGLPNRAKFYQTLENAVAAASPPLVMLIDLDGFKAVNDSHGHAAGDELLCVVADRLRHAVRAGDLVARLGGDEFAIVIQGPLMPQAAVERLAAAICESLALPVKLRSTEVQISASVGISDFSARALEVEEFVQQADAAMYDVKRGGRHGYKWYQPAT